MPRPAPSPEEDTGGAPSNSEALRTIKRYNEKIRNPLTAIRAKCVECSGGSLKEVNECRVTACALHQFRMGTNPLRKKRTYGSPDDAADHEDDDGSEE